MKKREAKRFAYNIVAGQASREASNAGAWADNMSDEDVEKVQKALEGVAKRLDVQAFYLKVASKVGS